MLFKRREAESWLNRLRVHVWPRRSWGRSTRYVVHRVRRLSATPHAVALGFAAGVFISSTPFIGFHMILSAAVAWIIGGSMVAALLGTFVGNPLTYPLFWVGSYEVGSLMLGGGDGKVELDLSNLPNGSDLDRAQTHDARFDSHRTGTCDPELCIGETGGECLSAPPPRPSLDRRSRRNSLKWEC